MSAPRHVVRPSVPVERHAGAVVAHGGAGIGVAGGFLHVSQWYERKGVASDSASP
jgi:hypothetical protein